MYKIVYLPTGEVIEYPKDFSHWFKSDSPFAKDLATVFLEANQAYQDYSNPEKIFFLTYDELIARMELPGKIVPKHLLEVLDV